MDDDQPAPEKIETPGPQIKADFMQALQQYKQKEDDPAVTEKKNEVKSELLITE